MQGGVSIWNRYKFQKQFLANQRHHDFQRHSSIHRQDYPMPLHYYNRKWYSNLGLVPEEEKEKLQRWRDNIPLQYF